MNPLGVHALVWTGDWTPESARFAIESTRETGFDLIEISLHDTASFDAAGTRQLLADNGLGVACSLGLAPDADVSSEDPAVVQRGRDLIAAALECAADVGASHLCGVLYSDLRKYMAPVSEKGRRNAVEAMAWLSEQAAGAGITLALEVVNRYETNVVNTAAEMRDFVAETGRPITLHLDTYHMNIEENGFVAPVEETGDQLGYVHIGESHRGYLGSGTIDFDGFFGALKATGYTGPVTFESFSSAVVARELSNKLGVWRNLWDDGRDLATHARAFMAERLAR
ncbi:sugar phosphate isomerase/epimerase family protein [Blastococcus sp. SYSU DS0619]